MTLEDRVTKDSVFYIHSIDYNTSVQCLIINFLGDPRNQREIVRSIKFQNIENFIEELDKDDFDEDCLDSLIGLQEFSRGDGIEYVVSTEQREIRFFTKVKPSIQEHPTTHS